MILKVGFLFYFLGKIYFYLFNCIFWGEISDCFVGLALISAIIHQSTRACVFHHGFLKYWETLDKMFFSCASHLRALVLYRREPNHRETFLYAHVWPSLSISAMYYYTFLRPSSNLLWIWRKLDFIWIL